MVVIKRPVDEPYEEKLQLLNEQFQELKNQVSETRKKGYSTEVLDLLLLDFPAKLKMAKATYEQDDLLMLSRLLDEIKSELQETEHGSLFSQVFDLVQGAYDLLRSGNGSLAAKSYQEVQQKYPLLSSEEKRLIYVACLDLRKRLAQEKG